MVLSIISTTALAGSSVVSDVSGVTAFYVAFIVGVYTNGVMVNSKFVKQDIPANAQDFPLSVTVTSVPTENTVLKAFVIDGFLSNRTIAYAATFPSSDVPSNLLRWMVSN